MCKVSEGLTTHTVLKFEDNGQDFLEWHLDKNGKVVDAKPFQGSVYIGAQMIDYVEGECPVFVHPRIPGEVNQLIHRIKEVTQVVTRK